MANLEQDPWRTKRLKSWMNTLIRYVRSGEPDLTNRQMALMMLVYLTPGPHTVRGLAQLLGVSKPVITRALNTLGSLGYLRRVRDESDRRNVFVAQTNTGQDFLEGFERNLEQSAAPRSATPGKRIPPPDTDERFHLTGPSLALDPRIHAYRNDIADIALAGQIFAPHYAARCRALRARAADGAARRFGGGGSRRRARSRATCSRCWNMRAAGPGVTSRPPIWSATSRAEALAELP